MTHCILFVISGNQLIDFLLKQLVVFINAKRAFIGELKRICDGLGEPQFLAKEHGRGQLEGLFNDKECLYVFDRGYLDYERFDCMTDEGYFFVSRLRKNTVVRSFDHYKLPEDTGALSDEMVVVGTSQNRSENVFRLLKVLDSKGNQLNLITNRFDLSADEIADLYKSRWAIELFF